MLRTQADIQSKLSLFSLCAVVALITAYNALIHPPDIGYDASQHLRYLSVLSGFHLPASMVDTAQYYNPPLYYGIPAMANFLSGNLPLAAKAAQFQNWFFCLGTLFVMLKLCDTLPPSGHLKFLSVILLTLTPAFYRTFAFVRAEPLLTLLAAAIAYEVILISLKNRWTFKDGLILGALLGLAILTRPSGWIFFCPVFIFLLMTGLKEHGHRGQCLKMIFMSLVTALILGGWFYLRFYNQHGTFIPFHREPGTPYFRQKLLKDLPPADSRFYARFDAGKVFTDPVRTEKIKERRFLESLYKDTWGDYEGYFLVYGIHHGKFVSGNVLEDRLLNKDQRPHLKTNRDSIRRYLGRVNLAGMLPSLIIAVGLFYGLLSFIRLIFLRKPDHEIIISALLFLFILFYTGGFLWASVRYIIFTKAVYLFPVYPLAAILGGLILVKLSERFRWIYPAAYGLLILCFIHNLPAFFTRYSVFTLASYGS